MRKTNGVSRHVRKSISTKRRAELLGAFDRSGLSAAAFARQHDLNYTTFCGWRHRRRKHSNPQFLEVEMPAPPSPTGLMIELGAGVCLSLNNANQIDLAARLIRSLNTPASC